jgi:hypothetical protein
MNGCLGGQIAKSNLRINNEKAPYHFKLVTLTFQQFCSRTGQLFRKPIRKILPPNRDEGGSKRNSGDLSGPKFAPQISAPNIENSPTKIFDR